MHVDVARGYFYAGASREMCIRLQAEGQRDGGEHTCEKLMAAMCGTRDAAQNWQTKCFESVRELGLVRGRASSCHFYQLSWRVCGLLYGDDFVFAGESAHLKRISAHMATRGNVTGPEVAAFLRALDHSIAWTPRGIIGEGDNRHADKLI